MKITYQDISFEVPIAPILFEAYNWLWSRFSRDPLRRLRGNIGLVSSRLFALKEGTTYRDEHGVWRAAPLLKPLANGTALQIQSGFPVTGLYDVFGQLAVAHALGVSGRSFTLFDDQNPQEIDRFSLLCFGGPTSNSVSGQIFKKLASILAPNFTWKTDFSAFTLGDSEFRSGADGVVLAYDSPWNASLSVVVSAGIGPAGTQAGAQLLTKWAATVPGRRQRKCRRFVAAVSYTGMKDLP